MRCFYGPFRKLDTVQKIASRIICGASRNTHSAPLLEAQNLESLDKRRTDHIISRVESIISENCHPALLNMFTVQYSKTSMFQLIRKLKLGSESDVSVYLHLESTTVQ